MLKISNAALLLLLVSLAFLGCKKDAESDDSSAEQSKAEAKNPGTGETAGTDTKPGQATKAPPKEDPPPTPHALDKLSLGSDASLKSLAARLPDYAVTIEEVLKDEGMTRMKQIFVKKGGKLAALATIKDAKIDTVEVFEKSYTQPDAGISPGEPFNRTEFTKNCYCVGEDGNDGFHCELEGMNAIVAVFEAKAKDCGYSGPEEFKPAIKGRVLRSVMMKRRAN